ncbi:MAG: Maf family protein [Armatimonadota bacterium]
MGRRKGSKPIILVSASPRRRELLQQVGIPFEVYPAEVDETLPDRADDPANLAIELARRKVRSVASQFPSRWLLAADTLVVVGKRLLGKPRNPEEAFLMLRQLSGRTHKVVTGLCLAKTDVKGRICRSYEASETTVVTFRQLTDDEIAAYISTGEPFDKAGAYGIQGKASIFVTKIVGCYFNVVGLPLAKLASLLKEAGFDVISFWETDKSNSVNRHRSALMSRRKNWHEKQNSL